MTGWRDVQLRLTAYSVVLLQITLVWLRNAPGLDLLTDHAGSRPAGFSGVRQVGYQRKSRERAE